MIDMITWIWIEGEKALNEFCERRFKEKPRFIETCGRVGPAKVRLIYKEIPETGHYTDMYLLYMDAPHEIKNGNYTGNGMLTEIQRMTYEEIRSDKTAILKRRG